MVTTDLILDKELYTMDVAQFVAATQGIGAYRLMDKDTKTVISYFAPPADILFFGDRNIYAYEFHIEYNGTDYNEEGNENGEPMIVCYLYIKCYSPEEKAKTY